MFLCFSGKYTLGGKPALEFEHQNYSKKIQFLTEGSHNIVYIKRIVDETNTEANTLSRSKRHDPNSKKSLQFKMLVSVDTKYKFAVSFVKYSRSVNSNIF